VVDPLIDRTPLLLLLGVLALAAHVAIVEVDDPAALVASVPAALLALAYLRAGRRRRGGSVPGGSRRDGAAGRAP
jgi:hypothetical protein